VNGPYLCGRSRPSPRAHRVSWVIAGRYDMFESAMNRLGRRRPHREAQMARLAWVCMAMSLAAWAGGCIVIPVPHGSTRFEHSRRAIDAAATRPVEAGVTRERVLLLLGEPDHVFDDGRAMAWHWVTCEWTLFWAAGGAG